MQELEKILEEIDQEIEKERTMCEDIEDTPGWRLYEKTMQMAKHIIHKHLSRENTTEITRSSRDSICGECSRRKWYLKGYEDGKKSNDGWIPVHKDNVPDNEILACDKNGNELIGYLDYDSEAEEFVCESNDVIAYQIIAWMEKPEPYRPERSKK